MYDERFVTPMRQELTRLGVEEMLDSLGYVGGERQPSDLVVDDGGLDAAACQ